MVGGTLDTGGSDISALDFEKNYGTLSGAEVSRRLAQALNEPLLDERKDGKKSLLTEIWDGCTLDQQQDLRKWLWELDTTFTKYDASSAREDLRQQMADKGLPQSVPNAWKSPAFSEQSREIRERILDFALTKIQERSSKRTTDTKSANSSAFFEQTQQKAELDLGEIERSVMVTPIPGQPNNLYVRSNVLRPRFPEIRHCLKRIEEIRLTIKPDAPQQDQDATNQRLNDLIAALALIERMDPMQAAIVRDREAHGDQPPDPAAKPLRLVAFMGLAAIAAISSIPLLAKIIKGEHVSDKALLLAGAYVAAALKVGGFLNAKPDDVQQCTLVSLTLMRDDFQNAVEKMGRPKAKLAAEELIAYMQRQTKIPHQDIAMDWSKFFLRQEFPKDGEMETAKKLKDIREGKLTVNPLIDALALPDDQLSNADRYAFVSALANPSMRLRDFMSFETAMTMIENNPTTSLYAIAPASVTPSLLSSTSGGTPPPSPLASR